MIHNIYSIYDNKAEHFSLPFYYQHEGQAIRQMIDWLNNPETPYAKHPSDFTLFDLGTYDDSTGTVEQEHINSITNLLPLKESQK